MTLIAENISPKDKFIAALESESGSFLSINRDKTKALLSQTEVPTTRNEYWKYTRVGKLINNSYKRPVKQSVNIAHHQLIPNAICLVFIDGIYSKEHSTTINSDKITLKSMASAKIENSDAFSRHFGTLTQDSKHFFDLINERYSMDGYFVTINDFALIENPVHVIHINPSENTFINSRNLIVVGKNAQAEVIQTFVDSSGKSVTNSLTEIVLEENAILDHYIVQNETINASQINTINVKQIAKSIYSIATITLNGSLIRNNLNINVEGKYCETNLSGLYITKGTQHIDNHTLVDHKEPNCNSNELYKGLIDDKSTAVFNGKVFVRQNAQKTNAFQSNQNILLSESASIFSKPELEIYADDVKCSHGSTTGQFDEEALFYLQARGIGKDTAQKLLIKAYASDVLDKLKNETLKEYLEKIIILKTE